MNLILSIPIEIRLILLFVLGTVLGGQLNRAIYRLAWNPRAIGPWSLPLDGVPDRHWSDRLPVVGWWGLRRETAWHGRRFWARPMLLELGTGIGLAWLYWLETERLQLWPSTIGSTAPDPSILHAQYLSHIILISLMIVATFIDFDERIIPDEITVTGTLIALVLAIALPSSLLPTYFKSGIDTLAPPHMVLTSSSTSPGAWVDGLGGPQTWPKSLSGTQGLVLGLLGIVIWYLAILHKTWTLRHGLSKAIRYLIASIRRHNKWQPALVVVVFSAVTLATWWLDAGAGGRRWQALLSAIVGMCCGGGLVWVVRIVGGHVLRTEAMGFGDVTLMAMIGAFLGWQAAFLTFFLAPITALLIATAQRLLTGDRHIAFGPYLCLAAVLVILAWDSLWANWALPMFAPKGLIPAVLTVCLIMMGGLLWMWRIVRDAVFGEP